MIRENLPNQLGGKAHKNVEYFYFIMPRVTFRNLLVRDAFKVMSLELAMSSLLVCLFWVVLLECTTSSNIPLGSKVQGCTALL